MAMLKLNPLTADIEGRIGRFIFWVDQCGQHMRIQPHYASWYREMTDANAAFQGAVGGYNHGGGLSPAEIEAWIALAERTPRMTRKGKRYTMTAYTCFIGTNIIRQLNGQPITRIAPAIYPTRT